MKLLLNASILLSLGAGVGAFAPPVASCVTSSPTQLFSTKLTENDEIEGADEMTLDEEVQLMVEKAMNKNKVITNLRNEKGVE